MGRTPLPVKFGMVRAERYQAVEIWLVEAYRRGFGAHEINNDLAGVLQDAFPGLFGGDLDDLVEGGEDAFERPGEVAIPHAFENIWKRIGLRFHYAFSNVGPPAIDD